VQKNVGQSTRVNVSTLLQWNKVRPPVDEQAADEQLEYQCGKERMMIIVLRKFGGRSDVVIQPHTPVLALPADSMPLPCERAPEIPVTAHLRLRLV
jgi:hypothetical protein